MNERSNKDSLEGHTARNAALVESITSKGGDLNRDRTIDCFFFAPTEEDAISLSQALQAIGLRELSLSSADDDYELPWTVEGAITSNVTAFTSPQQTEQMVHIAAAHHSVFDGWGAVLDECPDTK